jgi:hypothetical protein
MFARILRRTLAIRGEDHASTAKSPGNAKSLGEQNSRSAALRLTLARQSADDRPGFCSKKMQDATLATTKLSKINSRWRFSCENPPPTVKGTHRVLSVDRICRGGQWPNSINRQKAIEFGQRPPHFLVVARDSSC